jgi:hypothetical protein
MTGNLAIVIGSQSESYPNGAIIKEFGESTGAHRHFATPSQVAGVQFEPHAGPLLGPESSFCDQSEAAASR